MDVRTGAGSPVAATSINSLKPFSSTSRLAHPIFCSFLFPLSPCPCLSDSLLTMSGQQCLRRLPAAMRTVPALRTASKAINRLPAARSYSAISKAASSGLLSQASRCADRLAIRSALTPDDRRPGQLSSQRLWTVEQTRSYGVHSQDAQATTC
jgi:hypothetical protein